MSAEWRIRPSIIDAGSDAEQVVLRDVRCEQDGDAGGERVAG
jgi:hypothetical protein